MRWLATAGLLAVLALVGALPSLPGLRQGAEPGVVRADAPGAFAAVGQPLPDFALRDLDGNPLRLADFRGQRVLLTFERSVDWWPFTKTRLVELRDAFARLAAMDDVVIVYVVPDNQHTAKARRFAKTYRLGERVTFAVDPGSAAIDTLGLRRPDPEPIETGVPHPTTYVLDRDGIVRFADVREDFHFWLDPELPLQALAQID